MGATTFSTTALGKDAREAFGKAVSDAQWEYGHGGYSGTIAEKHSFVLYEIPPGVRCSSRRFLDLIDEASFLAPVDEMREDLRFHLGRGSLTKTEMRKREAAIRKAEKQRDRFWSSLNPELARIVKDAARVYDDKWGPAVAIEIKGKEAVEARKYAGRAGTRDRVFLFCGYASC